MNLYHINSKLNRENSEEFDFFVICDNSGRLKEALGGLKQFSTNFKIISGKLKKIATNF